MAIISPGFLPVPAVRGGAIELFIEKTLPYLKKNFETTVFSIDDPLLKKSKDHVYFANQELDRILFSLKNLKDGRWAYIHQVGTFMSSHHYDVIYYHGRPEILAYLLRHFKFKSKLIYHVHNDFFKTLSSSDLNLLAKNIDSIIGVSQFIIKNLPEALNTIPKKVVYNGVDLNHFQNNHTLQLRKIHNIPEKDFILLFAGRFNPVKGLHFIINAFNKVSKNSSKIWLVFIGSADAGTANQKYYQRLRKQTQNNPQIIWHGFVPPYDLPQFYKDADVFISPSIWDDPFPMAFIEALASGLPVLSTRRGGIPEMIKDQKNGTLVPGEEQNLEKQLIYSIKKYLKSVSLLRKHASGAIKSSKNYSWKKTGAEMAEAVQLLFKK